MDQAHQVRRERLRSLWQALRRQLTSHIALIRFGLVGGSGYLLYQGVLFLMYDSQLVWFLPAKDTHGFLLFFEHGDVRLLITTLVASPVVVVTVFMGHNLWTFRDRDLVPKPILVRFGQFLATALIAVSITTATVNVLTVQFDMYHFIALPIGVALGGLWDWLWYSRFIWRRAKKPRHGG